MRRFFSIALYNYNTTEEMKKATKICPESRMPCIQYRHNMLKHTQIDAHINQILTNILPY